MQAADFLWGKRQGDAKSPHQGNRPPRTVRKWTKARGREALCEGRIATDAAVLAEQLRAETIRNEPHCSSPQWTMSARQWSASPEQRQNPGPEVEPLLKAKGTNHRQQHGYRHYARAGQSLRGGRHRKTRQIHDRAPDESTPSAEATRGMTPAARWLPSATPLFSSPIASNGWNRLLAIAARAKLEPLAGAHVSTRTALLRRVRGRYPPWQCLAPN